jgi:hypothetical protein
MRGLGRWLLALALALFLACPALRRLISSMVFMQTRVPAAPLPPAAATPALAAPLPFPLLRSTAA